MAGFLYFARQITSVNLINNDGTAEKLWNGSPYALPGSFECKPVVMPPS